jgi:Tol biopolymer transport system component
MNSDGSNQTNLTHNAALDAFPAFSADGRRIAFSSDRTTGTGVDNADGDDEIFRMGAGGSRRSNSPSTQGLMTSSPGGSHCHSSAAEVEGGVESEPPCIGRGV